MIQQLRRRVASSFWRSRIAEHESRISKDWPAVVQLTRLNHCWQRALTEHPTFRDLKVEHGLPSSFDCLEQFAEQFPRLTREKLAGVVAGAKGMKHVQWRATGGTTSKPFHFPVFASEARQDALARWRLRIQAGIRPGESTALLWGHSHLFASRISRISRRLKDAVAGYDRISVYHLDDSSLREIAIRIARRKPRYICGYSTALDRLARTIVAEEIESVQGIDAVVATAEGLPFSDSRELVGKAFDAPVLMEYGAVETGIVAHEIEAGHYEIAWENAYLETTADGELLITSLYPRALPLFRYPIGDRVSGFEMHSDTGKPTFKQVIGRCNANVELANGVVFHSELITHAVRDIPRLSGYQWLNSDRPRLELTIRGEADVNRIRETIQSRLQNIDEGFAAIPIEIVDTLRHTIAGKIPVVWDLRRGES